METAKPKELWEKVKSFFKNMSMKVRIILCAAVVLVVAGIIVAAVLLTNSQPYTTLFTELSTTEASSIRTYLLENGITDFKLEDNTISVREDQATDIMSRLVQAGYPRDGYLYETYFEKVGLTTTNSERNEIIKIALEEKLSAVIRTFPGVRDANVSIALGQSQTYVLEDVQTESKVGVMLTMVDGYTLTPEQAESIRNFIGHSVRDLDLSRVSIEDTNGNIYAADTVANLADSSQLKLALEEYYRNTIRTGAVALLKPIYGPNNVSVMVTVNVDVNRRVRESSSYSQPEGSYENGGLIGQETILGIVSGDGVETVGGIPGTTTNSDVDIPTYMEDLLQAAEDGTLAEWFRNVENKLNETTEQVEIIAGTLTDVRVSVTINSRSPNAAEVNVEDLASHLATVVGIDNSGDDDGDRQRVSVLIAPFYEEPVEPAPTGMQLSMPFIIIGAAVLLALIVVLLLITGTNKKKKKAQEEEQRAAMEAQLGPIGADGELQPGGAGVFGGSGLPGEQPPATGADIMDINTEKSMELRKMVRQFAQNNPEIAAQMVKAWLKGDEDNG